MAVKDITKTNLILNTWSEFAFAAATTAADGVTIDLTGKDEYTTVLALNGGSGAATVIVKKGDGIQGVNDIAAFSIGAGEYAAIRLDSGAFKNVSGALKGKALLVPSSTDVTFATIELA